jgi:hypothetical protein
MAKRKKEFGRIELPKGKTANERAKETVIYSQNKVYKIPQRTAGKWEVDSGMVQTVDGIAIAYMAREESRTIPVERDANAHSIALLPEIIEQLTNLVDASRLVVERWESGDLADAVNGLRVDADSAAEVLATTIYK